MALTTSFMGKIWKEVSSEKQYNDSLITHITNAFKIPEISARLLVNRGIQEIDEIENFLDAKLKNIMPDPLTLLDMDKAVQRTLQNILSHQEIFISGDYDVDGITATYLLVNYFTSIGVSTQYHLPNRFTDGYGTSVKAIQKAAAKNINLFISVDSGTSAIDEVEEANKMGIDMIILDHHMPSSTLPNAIAIVNPNRFDQKEVGIARIKNLCAAGVVFLFLVALNRELKKLGFFQTINEPKLTDFIGVVALGTLCDVMEIRGLNRSYVNYAIKQQRFPLGIQSLIKVSNKDSVISAEDFSFAIGPAINAAGRLEDPSIALRMLLSDNRDESEQLAIKLTSLNEQRKHIEKTVLAEAMSTITQKNLHLNKSILIYGQNWHEGVIGIIAGKLKDRFNKPTFVVTFDEEGKGKGSARSVQGIDLSKIINEAKQQNILLSGGGHALAGGFSLSLNSIEKFNEFLQTYVDQEVENILNIDCFCPSCIDIKKLTDEISILEPFGHGVEKPIFGMNKLTVQSMNLTQNGRHMAVSLLTTFNKTIRAMIFNVINKPHLIKAINSHYGYNIDIAFTISNNQQYGPSMIIEDARLSIQ